MAEIRRLKNDLDTIMVDKGYLSVRENVYARTLVGSVDIYLRFEFFGKHNRNVSCEYGLSDNESIDFSYSCYTKYGNKKIDRGWNRPLFNLKFGLGRISGWGMPDALSLYEHSHVDIAHRIRSAIDDNLEPRISSIRNIFQYIELIASDEPWLPWYASNGPVRAGEYIFLALKHGENKRVVIEKLMERHSEISYQLWINKDPDLYVKNVIEEYVESYSSLQ